MGECIGNAVTRFPRLNAPAHVIQGRVGGHHVHVQGRIQQHLQFNIFRRRRRVRGLLHDQPVLRGHVGAVFFNRRYPKPKGKSWTEDITPCRVLDGNITSL